MLEHLEVYKTLVISTAHIKETDLRVLDVYGDIFTVIDGYFNTRLYLHENIINDLGDYSFSEGLKLVVLFGISNGCRFIDIDSDGPTYKGFPTYDW